MGMNERMKAFCEYYCGECAGNTVQAAKKAGYSESYATNMSYKLLKRQDVKDYIQELNEAIADDRIADVKEIQEYWTGVMRNIAEKPSVRLNASIQLAKCKGMFDI